VAPLVWPGRHGGRPRKVDVGEVVNAVFCVLSTGCQWRALAKHLPAESAVWNDFSRREWGGGIARIHRAPDVAIRDEAGRDKPLRC
jgi:transposase